jgi:hypothetical protein
MDKKPKPAEQGEQLIKERQQWARDVLKNIREKVVELGEINKIIGFDIRMCEENISRNAPVTEMTDQFWRRNLIRALFAGIEAVVYDLKQLAIAVSEAPGIDLTPGDRYVLLEKDYVLQNNGAVKPRDAKIRTLDNLCFVFRAFSALHLSVREIDPNDAGWKALVGATKIRDRLMHPKGSRSLVVTNTDLDSVQAATRWFTDYFTAILDDAGNNLEQVLTPIVEWAK